MFGGLRRLHDRGGLADGPFELAVRALATLPIDRYPLTPLLAEAHHLGRAFAPADSFYVALARLLDATLLTCDAPLGRAARELAGARTIVVERQ